MLTTIRQDIISSFHADYQLAFPDVPITYDNQPFDWNNPPAIFTKVEIKSYAGHQISMGANPKARYYGYIYITVYMKEGMGTVKGLQVLDWFADNLGFRHVGTVQIEAPSPVGGDTAKGYALEEMKFAYYADQT